MTSPLEQFSPSSPRLGTGTPLSQQLLKVILPTTLLPLIFAGAINWKLTDQRAMHEVQERTWNQSMLAADVSDSVAGTTGLTGKQKELDMVVEHAALSPSTQIRIIDLSSLKVLASLNAEGVESESQFKDEAYVQSKLLALGKELKEKAPPANKLPQPGKQPTYVTQQQNLENLVIQPFVHEEGIYALATYFESGDYYYSVATVPNRNWVAVTTVALSEIHSVGLDAIKLYLVLTIGLAIATFGITLLTARKLTQPLVNITETVKTAATGDLNVQVQVQGSSEVQVLAHSFNTLINQVRDFLWQQSAETQRSQMLRDLSLQLSQGITEPIIQQTTVDAVRQILKTDRVLIYQFASDWSGTIVAESLGAGWGSAYGMHLKDPCFANGYASQYQQGRISITPDIYTADLTDCYLQQLSTLSVRASLIAPVLVGGQLNALLIAHECEGSRNWISADVELFTQVATQLGLNLERISLLNRMQALAQEQVAQREALQMGLLELLSRVESAAQGDLTVRADVEGEVGTVGDFFNAIIGSLQTIVAQVKVSAEQVTESVHENEVAIQQLAHDAKQQVQELSLTLRSIDRMTESIHTVAANAQEAAEVARSASSVAEVSSSTMDRAVSTIVSLRNTVAETSVKVQRLGEASKQISKVVELINQFALETNMLAINAGIEAARAGEEGRGFAVVAQEVGTLAAQSANATKEIEQIVASIQRETGALIQAMQSGKTQVEEGTQLIEDTKQGLNQIFGVSQQIDHLVQAISTATVEQVETSQAVAELMQQLAQVSERTSESSQSVSNALQQTVAVTQQLQASVRTFKVADEG